MVSEEEHKNGNDHHRHPHHNQESSKAASASSSSSAVAAVPSNRPSDPEENPEDGWDPALNQDEAIKSQEAQISEEIAARSSLIGDQMPLDMLLHEYSEEDHVYRSKISDLKKIYETMRKSRPDGNCFFRAFGFSLFNSLLNQSSSSSSSSTTQQNDNNNTNNVKEIDRLISVANGVLQDLHELGFTFTVDDFHDVFVESLQDLRDGNIRSSQQLLDQVFNENSKSDYLVVFLRLITSSHLQKNGEFFQAFIENGLSVKEFCSHEVEPMYKESDHIHVIAITAATGVGVRITYLDRGGSADKINVHDFPEGVTDPVIHLLYRPGHYDVLYPRKGMIPSTTSTAASTTTSIQDQQQHNSGNSSCRTATPGKTTATRTTATAAAADEGRIESHVTSSSPISDASTPPSANGGGGGSGSNGESSSISSNECASASQRHHHNHPQQQQQSSSSSTTTTTTTSSVGCTRSHPESMAGAVSSSSPFSTHHHHTHHQHQHQHPTSESGVSSSKNPRLDPSLVSSSGTGVDNDDDEAFDDDDDVDEDGIGDADGNDHHVDADEADAYDEEGPATTST